jgi:PAT family beta-lactamase induction signal transducer AmpG
MPLPSLFLAESRPLRYVTFFYLYVMQGLPAGFALTALANYLAAEGARPAVIGSFAAVVGLPWAAQFVWGPLIDRFQGSALGRRRPWVVGSQLLAFLASTGLLLVRDPVAQVTALSAAFFVHSLFASVQDASVDAMAISVIPETERGRVNAFMRGGFLTGMGLGGAVFGPMLRHVGYSATALTLSGTLLTLTFVTFFIRERPGDALLPSFFRTRQGRSSGPRWQDPGFRWVFGELLGGLASRQSRLLFGPILTIYLGLSLFIRSFNIHLVQRLGWLDTELSVFTGTYATVVPLVVILLGGLLADRIGARRLLLGVAAITGAFLVIFNALSPYWPESSLPRLGLALWYTFDPVFSVAAMPVLMAICRKGVEGSQFTTYMALVNLSDIAGSYLAGSLLELVSAPVIGLLSGGLVLGAGFLVSRTLRENSRLAPG